VLRDQSDAVPRPYATAQQTPSDEVSSRSAGNNTPEQWFNVKTMDDFEYVLLDRATANFLGEWHTYEEAEVTYLEYVREAPEAVDRLELWHLDQRIQVDLEKIRAVTAA